MKTEVAFREFEVVKFIFWLYQVVRISSDGQTEKNDLDSGQQKYESHHSKRA